MSDTAMHEETPGPVQGGQRLGAIDSIRGFALFGVLLVNMFNFGASSPTFNDLPDIIASSFMRVFFETKSWRLFSFLFGLGFSIQWFRKNVSTRSQIYIYIRRIVILFLFGIIHCLIYDGDILMLYAELGLLLLIFVDVPPRYLLLLAAILLLIFPVSRFYQSRQIAEIPVARVLEAMPDPDQLKAAAEERRRTHPYAVGSIREVMELNAEAIPPNPFEDTWGLTVFAFFLLGLYTGKKGILTDLYKHKRLLRLFTFTGFALGLLGMVIERFANFKWHYEAFGEETGNPGVELWATLAFSVGSTALALAYAGLIALFSINCRLQFLVRPFEPAGRFALTVYLTQSLIFTTLFYGYGFGKVGQLGPLSVSLFALAIFVIQVLICIWWSKYFRFGPFEWLWRSLTYLKFQPMKLH